MNIFLSYSSARRDVAERLKLGLEAEQHDVFFDRDDLGAGESYQQAIREAVAQADLMLFLVSPESVAPGSYTLAELEMAEAVWPQPSGRVLPVVVAATPKSSIPPYLLAVTLLEPQGEVVAETLATVARLSRRGWRRGLLDARIWAAVAVVVVVGSWAVFGYRHLQTQREAAAAQARQLAVLNQEVAVAARLCLDGGYADGFAQLGALATRVAAGSTAAGQATAVLNVAREDCAMAWLRWGRRNPGETSFAQLVAPLRPVLAQALVAGASGQRAADLRAHLGWADRLVWIDEKDPSIDPTPHFRQALALDPDNVYGHAMWGFWLLARQPGSTALALQHYQQATRSGRHLSFVRTLQLGSLVTSDELGAEAMRVLNQMRLGQEVLDPDRLPRIWSYLYAPNYQEDKAARLLAALPPEEGLRTFLWLFPRDRVETSRTPQWRLTHALLLVHAGQAGQARPDLLALQQELGASKASGTLPGAVSKLLARL